MIGLGAACTLNALPPDPVGASEDTILTIGSCELCLVNSEAAGEAEKELREILGVLDAEDEVNL